MAPTNTMIVRHVLRCHQKTVPQDGEKYKQCRAEMRLRRSERGGEGEGESDDEGGNEDGEDMDGFEGEDGEELERVLDDTLGGSMYFGARDN